jgi:hypothetical protein
MITNKKQADDFGVVLDHFSSDDDLITKGEKQDDSSNFDLLSVIDINTKKK